MMDNHRKRMGKFVVGLHLSPCCCFWVFMLVNVVVGCFREKMYGLSLHMHKPHLFFLGASFWLI